MKRRQVELSPEARRHVRVIEAWWAANRRAAQNLFADELEAAVARLETTPASGRPYPHPTVAGVRRLLLPRTRYGVYYLLDEDGLVVRIHAIWHTSREGGPPLE